MAAGIGNRYGGLKQMDPVGPSGELIIDYSVYDALKAGFSKIVFIIRKSFEADFRDIVGKKIEKKTDVDYVFQELDSLLPPGVTVPKDRQKPWGTGHAVLTSKHCVSIPFAVINADDYYGSHSFKVLGDYLNTAADADGVFDYSMVGFVLKNTLSDHGYVARGVCTANEQGYLKDIHERTRIEKIDAAVKYTEDGERWIELSPESIVSMNMWGFTPSLFEALEKGFKDFYAENFGKPKAEFFLPTVVDALVQAGKARVKILPCPDKWYGVTYKQDHVLVKAAMAQFVASGVYPKNIWERS